MGIAQSLPSWIVGAGDDLWGNSWLVPSHGVADLSKLFLTLSFGKFTLTVSDSLPISTARRPRRRHPARDLGPTARRPVARRQIGRGVPRQPPRDLATSAGSEAGQPRYR